MSAVESLYRAAKALRGYANPVQLALDRWVHRPHVTVEDRATRLRFRCRRGADRMFAEVFHSRLYDIPLAPVGPGDLVLDLGANHGFAAAYFAKRGARVIAYEPSPAVYPLLLENLGRNTLLDKVDAIEAAVSDRSGAMELLISDRLGGGMSTLEPGFARNVQLEIGSRITVRTVALTDLLNGLGQARVRLLKIDCEGSELRMLSGLNRDHLARIDSIALEYHVEAYALKDLIELLQGWQDFSLSKVPETDTANANLHVVHRRVIADWAGRSR